MNEKSCAHKIKYLAVILCEFFLYHAGDPHGRLRRNEVLDIKGVIISCRIPLILILERTYMKIRRGSSLVANKVICRTCFNTSHSLFRCLYIDLGRNVQSFSFCYEIHVGRTIFSNKNKNHKESTFGEANTSLYTDERVLLV